MKLRNPKIEINANIRCGHPYITLVDNPIGPFWNALPPSLPSSVCAPCVVPEEGIEEISTVPSEVLF
eukprot:430314-Amorphochlora_amoeboformis.AAC.1